MESAIGPGFPCLVCVRRTNYNHYGAAVCNSCASFFRRTVSHALSYKCTCRLPFLRKKKGCRHCRFERCLRSGMDSSEVKVIKPLEMPPQNPEDTLISTALVCRNRLYVERGVLLSKIDTKYRTEMGPSASRTFEQICLVESEVLSSFCNDYLKSFSNFFKLTATPSTMSGHFFNVWVVLEQLLATMHYAQQAMCFEDYTTALPADYAILQQFFRQITWINDAEGMARLTLQLCLETIDSGKSFRRAALDDRELIAFLHLLVAHYEREFFIDDVSRKEFVDRVLRELHQHYKSTYLNFTERLGTLTSLLGDFHTMFRSREHFDTVASFYSDDTASVGLTPDEQAILDFNNPQRSIKLDFSNCQH